MFLIRINWGQGYRFMNRVMWSKDYIVGEVKLFNTEQEAKDFAIMQCWACPYEILPDIWG